MVFFNATTELDCGGGGGARKIHPGRRNLNLVGGGGANVAVEKKTPEVEKVPGLGGGSGAIVGVEKMHVSGAQLLAPE